MARTIIVLAVFALVTIGAPWSVGAEPMPPTGTDVAPTGTDKVSPGNDDHVVGDDLC